MAISVGSRVALKNLGVDLSIGQVNAQPILFGVSQTADPTTPCVIDWENGLQSSVTLTLLDEILAANPTTLNLVGQVVNVTGQSAAYAGVVIAAYNRSNAQECVQVKTLANGAYFEYDAASVKPVAGQN